MWPQRVFLAQKKVEEKCKHVWRVIIDLLMALPFVILGFLSRYFTTGPAHRSHGPAGWVNEAVWRERHVGVDPGTGSEGMPKASRKFAERGGPLNRKKTV